MKTGLRCWVGCLVYCVGHGKVDPHANRGHVGVISSRATKRNRDWKVLIPGKPSSVADGMWDAKDEWLIPIGEQESAAADTTRMEVSA